MCILLLLLLTGRREGHNLDESWSSYMLSLVQWTVDTRLNYLHLVWVH